MRYGNQHPTHAVVCPYNATKGTEALDLYRLTGRTPEPWQEEQINNILAIDEDLQLWTHSKYGYAVPRRNGKGEIIAIRELYGLHEGEKILHTAHRTTTSTSAALRLANLLHDMGYEEVLRVQKNKKYEKSYVFAKQVGMEKITLLDTGGTVSFRTRTSVGGLGEGFDLLFIDEAQEYTVDMQNTLQYCVSDSRNPQIILCGTPPTAVSKGTVFQQLRTDCLAGKEEDTGWAEWSVEEISDVNDVDIWYWTNPAMGYQLNERKVKAEDKSDELDFNIQRFGYWSKTNLKSAISKSEWMAMKVEKVPKAKEHSLFVGVKFGKDGTNAALSIAFKTADEKVFVEVVDCKPIRDGFDWIVDWLIRANNVKTVAIDGANGQSMLEEKMKKEKLKKPIFPTVKEFITANSMFEQAVFNCSISHMGQEELANIVGNCEKRSIGSNGGFGYKAQMPDGEIALMDSVILAHWLALTDKGTKKQQIIC